MGTLGLEWSAWAARKIRTPRQVDLAVLSVIQTAVATVFPEKEKRRSGRGPDGDRLACRSGRREAGYPRRRCPSGPRR